MYIRERDTEVVSLMFITEDLGAGEERRITAKNVDWVSF